MTKFGIIWHTGCSLFLFFHHKLRSHNLSFTWTNQFRDKCTIASFIATFFHQQITSQLFASRSFVIIIQSPIQQINNHRIKILIITTLQINLHPPRAYWSWWASKQNENEATLKWNNNKTTKTSDAIQIALNTVSYWEITTHHAFDI